MTKRRALLLASGAWVALATSQTLAQSPKPRRIAFLMPSTREFSKPQHDAFVARLKELGYSEGGDIVIERRWADGSNERLPALARELLAAKPEVVIAPTVFVAAAFRKETSTVPIVFIAVENPEADGFVASLARPGGNMTGITWRGPAMAVKLRELLREILPAQRRIAVLALDDPVTEKNLPVGLANFAKAGFEAEYILVKRREDFGAAFARIERGRAEILWVAASPLFVSHATELARMAAKARVPMVGTRRAFTDAGGLLSYDNDLKEDYRRAAGYVDRILKGAKPADLPVEQPERFHLAVNLRSAKALGIRIPQSVLLRADEVIE